MIKTNQIPLSQAQVLDLLALYGLLTALADHSNSVTVKSTMLTMEHIFPDVFPVDGVDEKLAIKHTEILVREFIENPIDIATLHERVNNRKGSH